MCKCSHNLNCHGVIRPAVCFRWGCKCKEFRPKPLRSKAGDAKTRKGK